MPTAASGSVPSRESARLTFVTGKGGVGKTTVAAGITRSAAADGERVLAVDVAASGQLRAAVAHSDASVLDLTTEASIDEYVKLYLKVPIAPSSLPVLAGVFDFVSTAAPAVREILTVGKIGYEAVEGNWDRIVVDGPATGHIVELLTAPDDLQRLAPAGPLANQTGWLQAVLVSETTDLVVVAQPEELVVNETTELIERVKTTADVDIGAIVVNRLLPELSSEAAAEALVLAERGRSLSSVASLLLSDYDRQRRFQEELSRLADELDVPCLLLGEHPSTPVDEAAKMVEVGRWR